jgi:putative phosphoribosyl transferase
MKRFVNRLDAGRQLAGQLKPMRGLGGSVVVGLPRGGVPVAYEVAIALDAPLDVLVVRKIGVPFQPEVAMGAIGEGGVRVVDQQVMAAARISNEEFVAVEGRERVELERRVRLFRGERGPVSLVGRTVVIVDDGVATGSTARAACRVARARGASRVVLAVPVAAAEALRTLASDADEVVSLVTAEGSFAVGQWYDEFDQTLDEEVVAALVRAGGRARDDEVNITIGSLRLPGHLTIPVGASSVVVFVHGSGSSRHSPRNRAVAESLNALNLGTLLFDLLTVEEEQNRANVFDIGLLTSRLIGATGWLESQVSGTFKIGYFGASTGAAAALLAAAEPTSKVAAVVARGGRVDMAGDRLGAVRAPTLFVVGGADTQVLELNRTALAALRCERQLEVVEGATHLFEEPGTMDEVARLAGSWFQSHLTGDGTATVT